MSILDFIHKTVEAPDGASVKREYTLGETLSSLQYHNLLHSDIVEMFNSYDYTITISPKNCDRFKEITPICNKCNRTETKVLSVEQQYIAFLDLFTYLRNRYNIHFLIIFELYKDNSNIHCHGMIKANTITTLKTLKDIQLDIYTFFRVPVTNRVLLQIQKPKCLENWATYLMKEQGNTDLIPLVTKQIKKREIIKVKVSSKGQLIGLLKKIIKDCDCENEKECQNCEMYTNFIYQIISTGTER